MADLQQYNIVGQFQQGYDRGQGQRANRLAGLAYSSQGADRQSALGQLAGVNPSLAVDLGSAFQKQDAAQQKLEVDHAKKINGAARYVLQAVQSGDQNRIQGAYQAVRPYLAELGAAQGKVPPDQFDPSMLPKIYEIVGQTGGDAITSGSLPTGFREFQMTAEAAGLKPGTPEYQQAANIALGREGRASSAGIGFQKVTGADGRERIGRTNPRTGAFEVYNEQSGQFEPMGGPMGAQGAQSAPAAIQSLLQQANQAVQMGADPAKVDQWLHQQTAQIGGVQVQPVSNPALAVGRAPEDTAYAKEQATQRAQLEALPQREAIQTEAEADRARNKSGIDMAADKAKREPKARLALEQATQRIGRVDDIVNSILPRIGMWTAGFMGSKAAKIPGTPAYDMAADLKTLQAIAGFDQLNAMRAASPTGGALGNVTEREMEFLQSVVRNIQNSQSPEQLRRNLLAYQQAVKDSWRAVNAAYQQDFGQPAPAQSGGVDDLLSKYGVQ